MTKLNTIGINNPKLEIGKVYTGKEFNEINNLPLYKLTNNSEKHYGFKYQTGLNVDTKKFNPTKTCLPGGLYFCDLFNVKIWYNYYQHIREVIIPDDAEVYVEDGKYKANMIYLSEKTKIANYKISNLYHYMVDNILQDLLSHNSKHIIENIPLPFITDIINEYDEELLVKFVILCPKLLQYVINQNNTLCLFAVRSDGLSLEYVKNKNELICLEAVKQNAKAIIFSDYQTKDICLEVVKQIGILVCYIKTINRTEDVCLESVKQNGLALKYIGVKNQTKRICSAAIKQNKDAKRYVKI